MKFDELVTMITKEIAVIKDAPILFTAGLIIMAGPIWVALNWQYSSRLEDENSSLASKGAQVDFLQTQVSSYKDKLNGASPDEIKARIDALELQIKELTPRRLTAAQKKAIADQIRMTRTATAIAITADGGCGDCNRFAGDIASSFDGLTNWNVSTPMILGPGQSDNSGVTIFVPDTKNLSEAASALVRGFGASGVAFGLVQRPSSNPMIGVDSVEVLVTVKLD